MAIATAPGRSRRQRAAPEPVQYEYLARPGGHLKNADAAVVGATLLQIQIDAGAITTDLVVDEARDEGSPLHGYFTWDDTVAAEAHRRTEARRLIRSVVIRPVGSGIAPAAAFYNLREPEQPRQYRPLSEVLGEQTRMALVMRRFKDDIRRIQLGYLAFRGTAAFSGHEALFLAIEDALRD